MHPPPTLRSEERLTACHESPLDRVISFAYNFSFVFRLQFLFCFRDITQAMKSQLRRASENMDQEFMATPMVGYGNGNSPLSSANLDMLEPTPIVSIGSLVQVVPAIVQLPPSLRQNCSDYLDALGALNDESPVRGGYPGNQPSQGTIHFPSRFDHQQMHHFDHRSTPYGESFNMDRSVNYSMSSAYSASSQMSSSQPRNSSQNKKGGRSVSMILNSFGQST